jgi:hypothetical protein
MLIRLDTHEPLKYDLYSRGDVYMRMANAIVVIRMVLSSSV